jgi:protein TonB
MMAKASVIHPRTLRVSAAVVATHAALLWLALHSLSTPTLPSSGEHLILASVVAEVPAMVTARPTPAPTPAQATQRPPVQTLPRTTAVQTAPSAVLAAAAESTPVTSTAPASPATAAQTSAQTSARTAAPAPAAVVLPSSDADYLNNPAPVYPRMSRRMGEQGTVLVRVLISADGRAEQAEIRTSSGYARLDEAALDTVKRWRYVPGKRAGTAEAMWFNVPVRFVLD